MNKNLYPENRKTLLDAYRALPDEEKKSFDQGLMVLSAYYAFIYGGEDRFEFASRQEKRHTLLAYKHLGLVWFDKLPTQIGETFPVKVNEKFPETLSTEMIIAVSGMSDRALEDACAGLPEPTWDRKPLSIVASLALSK